MNKLIVCAIWLLAAATVDGVVIPASSTIFINFSATESLKAFVNPLATTSSTASPTAKPVTFKPEYRPSSGSSPVPSPTPLSSAPGTSPGLGHQGVVVKSLVSADSTVSSKLKAVGAVSAHDGNSNCTRSSVNGTAGAKWKKNSTASVGSESDGSKLPNSRSENKTTPSYLKKVEVSASENIDEVDGQQNVVAKEVVVTSTPTSTSKTRTSVAVSTRAVPSHAAFITLGAILVSAIATLAW